MNENTRNVILMIVFTMAIFLGYQFFYLGPVMEERTRAYEAQQAQLEAERAARGEAVVPTAPTGGAVTPNVGTIAPAVTSGAETIADAGFVTIDTPELEGRISLYGGRFDSLTLKSHAVELNSEERVDLLKPYKSDDAYFALFGWAAANQTPGFAPTGRTVWTADSNNLTPASPVTLSWDNGQGMVYKIRIAVDDHYLFTIDQSVENSTTETQQLAPYGLIFRAGIPESDELYILHEGPLGVFDGTFEEYSYDDFDDTPAYEQRSVGGWMGITDKYWMTVLIPDQQASLAKADVRRIRRGTAVNHQTGFLEDLNSVLPGQSFERTSHFFAGAKKVGVIDEYADRLGVELFDRTIDWGWFYFLTRPIFFLLDMFNNLTGNFGIAIIMLVIVLKAILFPLANRQYESMAHMKDAQPKMKALQERYKDDRVRLQQEMMALYKKEKINPLAGCLPLLPQVFIFFALYKVLYVTLEMRHQPFFGWIQDLSAPDPLTIVNLFGLIPWEPPQIIAIGIWPMLMGATMYLQQTLTPTQMDPTQKKIMNLLPIFFTFIMAGFSAGLVVYWTVNSGLSVLQQWVIMRRFEARKAAKAAR